MLKKPYTEFSFPEGLTKIKKTTDEANSSVPMEII